MYALLFRYPPDELCSLFPFLPKYLKDTTKPICFLESVDVTLVWKTENPSVNAQKKRKKAKQSMPSQETQALEASSSQGVTQSAQIAEGTCWYHFTTRKIQPTCVILIQQTDRKREHIFFNPYNNHLFLNN